MSTQEDSVWKDLLDEYLERFLEFFFPEIYADIDWCRGHEPLDKELEPLVRDAEIGKRFADKLVKVSLLDGRETWILIHIEIQGYSEKGFAERMYIYNFKIFERYHREVVSLAVLTDDQASFRPSIYATRRWGFEHFFRFPIVKVLDYRDRWDLLEKSSNPFAMVVMAHLKAQESRTDDQRLTAKLWLMRALYERGYARTDILGLFRFIDWILVLPKELEKETHRLLSTLEGRNTVRYVTSIERFAREDGKEEGLKEGLEEGLKEGLLEGIELAIELRFGKEALRILPRLREIDDVRRLRMIKEAVRNARAVEDLEGLLDPAG